MGFLAEDLEEIIKAGVFLNLNRKPPVLLGGEYSESEMPYEGIFIIDEDIDSGTGSDCYGKIIYEGQSCTVRAWTTSRPDRAKLKDDLVKIIEDDLANSIMPSILPIDFLDKHGIEITVRRLE